MKRIKKIKPKHLARVFLLLLISCFIVMFTCSFTDTITYSYIDEYGIESFDINIPVALYDFSDFQLLNYGDESTIPLSFGDENKILCESGVLYYGDDIISYVNLPDGYYSTIGYYMYTASYYDSMYIDVIPYCDEGFELVRELVVANTIRIYFVDSVPSNVSLLTEANSFGEGFENETFVLLLVPSPTVQDSITDVWSVILSWITGSIAAVSGIFWTGSRLTLIGTLAIVGVGIAILLLIFYKVKDFLHLR